jgi:hypothetical protein
MVLMGHDDLVKRSITHVSRLRISQVVFTVKFILCIVELILLQSGQTQFFETVIRYLGGLLSAYALTDNSVFLTHADELGMGLFPIFNTSTGLPLYAVNIKT